MALVRTIQDDPDLARVRLVLLTSWSSQESSVSFDGMATCLPKPIRQAQLYNTLVTVLGTATVPPLPQPLRHADQRAQQTPLHARVLVVEDNVTNQKVAARILEKLGYRVDVVANGLEAVETSGCIAYDCIFMDCQMPEMDGYEATRAIRQRDAQTGSHTLIIAMTANAMQGDRERCLKAGMDAYISKPVQPEVLATILQQWLQPCTAMLSPSSPVASKLVVPL
jgi:CheY-like chemotaxis protein